MKFDINKKEKTVLISILSIASVLLLSLFKISFFVGSKSGFFSGVNFLIPALGLFLSVGSSFVLVGLLVFKKLLFGGALTFGIPTLVATFSLRIMSKDKKGFVIFLSSFFLRVLLPLLCITLFVFHPIGSQAYIYSFYWFIPIALYFLQIFYKKSSFFTKALTSTLLSHAVGSVMWLYLANLAPSRWISLIPIVFLERFLFALGITLVYRFVCEAKSVKLPHYSTKKNVA